MSGRGLPQCSQFAAQLLGLRSLSRAQSESSPQSGRGLHFDFPIEEPCVTWAETEAAFSFLVRRGYKRRHYEAGLLKSRERKNL